jgi:hypothetical protein
VKNLNLYSASKINTGIDVTKAHDAQQTARVGSNNKQLGLYQDVTNQNVKLEVPEEESEIKGKEITKPQPIQASAEDDLFNLSGTLENSFDAPSLLRKKNHSE